MFDLEKKVHLNRFNMLLKNFNKTCFSLNNKRDQIQISLLWTDTDTHGEIYICCIWGPKFNNTKRINLICFVFVFR